MSDSVKAHLALFGAALIYGINYTVAKGVMPNYLLPYGFVLLRVVGSVILFWGFFTMGSGEKIERSDFPRLILSGVFGVGINQMMFFHGLSITTPINAAIIMVSNPILVLVISALALREALSVTRIAGIALGMAGAVGILIFKDTFRLGSDTWFGDLLILVNSASYAVYLVIVKPLMAKYSPTTVIKWVFLFGSVMVVPAGFQEAMDIDWERIPRNLYWSIFYVIVFTTFLTYLFNIYALKRVSPAIVSFYIYLQPLFATAIAVMVGEDRITLTKIVSALLIATGVYLVSIPTYKAGS